jgi:hypothetical protein
MWRLALLINPAWGVMRRKEIKFTFFRENSEGKATWDSPFV